MVLSMMWIIAVCFLYPVGSLAMMSAPAVPEYTSALRQEIQPGNMGMAADRRTAVVVFRDAPDNVHPGLELRILAMRHGYQQNLNWHTRDGIEFFKRLRKAMLAQQSKQPSLPSLEIFLSKLPNGQVTADKQAQELLGFLHEKEKPFNASVSVFRGIRAVTNNLEKLLAFKRRMLEISDQIELQARWWQVQQEVEALLAALEKQEPSILAIAQRVGQLLGNCSWSANVSAMLNQVLPIGALSNRFRQQLERLTGAISEGKKQIEQQYLLPLQAVGAQLQQLYESNKMRMQNIILKYDRSNGTLLDRQSDSKIYAIRQQLNVSDTLVEHLEKGVCYATRGLDLEMASGESTQQNLTGAVSAYRSSLTRNALDRSSIAEEVGTMLLRVKPACDAVRKETQNYQQEIKVYNASVTQLLRKLKQFSSAKSFLSVELSKFEPVQSRIGQMRARIAPLADELTLGLQNISALKFHSFQYGAAVEDFLQTFPQKVEALDRQFVPFENATTEALMQLEVVIAELQQAATAETLGRALQRFMLSQEESISERRPIFVRPSPLSRRRLRIGIGTVPQPQAEMDPGLLLSFVQHT